MARSEKFSDEFKDSGYQFSDEFLFEEIQKLREEVSRLKNKLESDGK